MDAVMSSAQIYVDDVPQVYLNMKAHFMPPFFGFCFSKSATAFKNVIAECVG